MRQPPKFVAGIIDGYGAVDSSGNDVGPIGHAVLFPGVRYCRWRWCEQYGLRASDGSRLDDPEELDAVRRHLERKFGICD